MLASIRALMKTSSLPQAAWPWAGVIFLVRALRSCSVLVFRSFAGRSVPVSLMADGVRGVGWGPRRG